MEGGHRQCFNLKILSILLCVTAMLSEEVQLDFALQDLALPDSQMRFARLRCLQQHPGAEVVNYTDNNDTHCYVQCFLYRVGLINLDTRGLDSSKFMDIWDEIEDAVDEKCSDRLVLDEPLSGKCVDYYRKVIEFRQHCVELFEYTFAINSTGKSDDPTASKSIGQSASEFCDSLDDDEAIMEEDYDSLDVSFLLQYKKKLECLLQNYHYIDAYGRVDKSEILLSYYEANSSEAAEARAVIELCAHRANTKYRKDYMGDLVLELQTCLKRNSPDYALVARIRDDLSRGY